MLKERGRREEPAVEKLSNLLLLTSGGYGHIKSNMSDTHMLLFKRMFGPLWLRMLLLHRMLTVPKSDLLQILGIAPRDNSILGDPDREAY